MASVEQQMQALNLQLSESNAQIGLMSLALDNLRNESGMAIQELRRLLAEAKSVDGDRRQKEVSFINIKVFEGGRFSGGAKESFKVWSRNLKIYLNSQHKGMRKALELAEESLSKVNVGDLQLTNWDLQWKLTKSFTISS